MALRLTKERFFTDLLDTGISGLSGIDRVFRESGAEKAEAQFGAFIRSCLPAERFFSQPEEYRENAWRTADESDLDVAERILAHCLMSCGELYDFGADNPVNWSFNPTYNQYREWTWQLSRHHEWRHLARMYRHTGDERYAKGLLELVRSFIDTTECPENASGFATDCWRTIELGIRLANNWPYTIFALYRSPSVTDADLTKFFMSLWENAWRLRNFNTSHNWLIMEMNGLLHTAVFFPFYRDAAEWNAYALRRLREELDLQFYPDNFQFEMTTGYHGCVLGNYFGVMRLCRLMEIPLTPEFLAGVRRGFLMYIQLMEPDGKTPALNDGYRADTRAELAAAEEFFPGDPLFRWFLTEGKEGTPPDYRSIYMPYSGMAVMRSGWEPDDSFAMLECAPFGRAHQHEDKLEVLLFAFGKNLLSDYGSYAYDSSDMRKYILSTYSHNTALVDGMGQTRRNGYGWNPEDITKKEQLTYRETEQFISAAGIYSDGYGNEKLPVTHKRTLIWLKNGIGSMTDPFWIVLDEFCPMDGASHTYDLLWHCPDNLPYNSDVCSVTYQYGDGVSLKILGTVTPKVVIGQKTPYMSGWKPVHQAGEHEHQPVPTAIFSLCSDTVLLTATLLLPGKDHPSPVESVRLVDDQLHIGLRDGGVETVRLGDYLPESGAKNPQ